MIASYSSGYPAGLQGEMIPIGSRIVSVIDAYDAITSTRSYRRAKSEEEGIKILQDNSGRQFDPEIVRIFCTILQGEKRILVDPVCGMAGQTAREFSYMGRTFHFCSEVCRQQFASNPAKYASRA